MQPLLLISQLAVEFHDGAGRKIRALNGVNLRVHSGETIGLLGESGCGKSTLARTLLRLLPANAAITKGSIEFAGRDVLAADDRDLEQIRGARISLIPQEPGLALNPLMKAGRQIAEVLRAHRDWTWRRCCEEADALLELVHLEDSARRMFDVYPHQLSGGQQQRVVIAQAISCQPAIVIADEPTASLDPNTEREILQLLQELKSRQKMAFLLITHDPKILNGLADHIAVMYAGRVIEEGAAEDVLAHPLHPYTKALVSCIPPPPGTRRLTFGERLPTIPGNSPEADATVCGCAFAPRCEHRMRTCEEKQPHAVEAQDGRVVECFLYER